jgi:hypothetical protein
MNERDLVSADVHVYKGDGRYDPVPERLEIVASDAAAEARG